MKSLVKLRKIDNTNKHWINIVKAKPKQRILLHYNAYWYGQSLIVDNIHCFLIKKENNYLGFVAFGPYYKDEYLQEKQIDIAEIIHLVIDGKYQKQGIGKLISEEIIQILKTQKYSKIYVAVSEENKDASLFWRKLNFVETSLKNYDDDNFLEFVF